MSKKREIQRFDFVTIEGVVYQVIVPSGGNWKVYNLRHYRCETHDLSNVEFVRQVGQTCHWKK